MYRVQLQQFEGPLDLLLFFIRRDEIDIHDIPIARIADEYLGYVRVLQEIDLDHVADFIYMAAILIGIKAKTLLPRPELDEEGEPIDPRAELVQRLLEYMRYKEAAESLERRHDERGQLFTRGHAAVDQRVLPEDEDVTYKVSVFQLVSALKRVMEVTPEPVLHPVERYSYTIEEQAEYVLRRLAERPLPFAELVRGRSKGFVVVTFLAILELAQQHRLRLRIGARADEFTLGLAEAAEAPASRTGTDG